MNEYDQAPNNNAMTAGRVLPWLQDTLQDATWTRWNVTYRDFRILDSQDRLVAVYNLTEHDLAVASNRDTLKQLLLQAAQSTDSNRDGLPDDWQLHYFGSLSFGFSSDPDSDGVANFTEFAFGTDPTDPHSPPPVQSVLSSDQGLDPVLIVRFRRRAGNILDYFIESSLDLVNWSSTDTALHLYEAPRNLFDGTGTSEVAYALEVRSGPASSRFVRIRSSINPRSATRVTGQPFAPPSVLDVTSGAIGTAPPRFPGP